MKKRPNILLLFTDQQRYDTIAACGYPYMKTPNLDRLAKEGCIFNNAYSPNPVCIPARHNLITGLPARHHGYAHNLRHSIDPCIPVLPRILSDGGYDTRAIGKMHFRPARRHNGFNKMELMEETPQNREDDDYAMYLESVGLGHISNIHGVRNLLYMMPQRSLIPEEHHGSTWVADRSIDFLKREAGRRPFFLWSSWIMPHPPFDVPEKYANLYSDAKLPQPLVSKTPISQRAEDMKGAFSPPEDKYNAILRRTRELYFAAVSMVDKNIGRVLDALKETGELENTLIIFTSDHGEMLGDHGTVAKALPYDSAAKIPFIVRYPEKIIPGTVRNEFVDLNDLLPTFLDVARLEYPGTHKLPGGSIFKKGKDRSVQYMENDNGHKRWISLRDKRYKYNYYYLHGREELFDMDEDPGECVNLLYGENISAEISDIHDILKEKLTDYEGRWGLENYYTINETNHLLKMEDQPWEGCHRSIQFPALAKNTIDSDKKRAMQTNEEEAVLATKDELVFKLNDLDIEEWVNDGANPDAVAEIISKNL